MVRAKFLRGGRRAIFTVRDPVPSIAVLSCVKTSSLIHIPVLVCPQSLDAMQGALGTVCEAVDTVLREDEPTKRAFVAIRPPGHHCGEDTPSGFCFLNNVAVGAAHGIVLLV